MILAWEAPALFCPEVFQQAALHRPMTTRLGLVNVERCGQTLGPGVAAEAQGGACEF